MQFFEVPIPLTKMMARALLRAQNRRGWVLPKLAQSIGKEVDLNYLLQTLEWEEKNMDLYLERLPTHEAPKICIGVVVTTYGIQKPYLEEFFDSIFQQTHKNFRILLCNDGDKSVSKYLSRLVKKHPHHIRFQEHQKNQGICAGTRTALSLASTETPWLAFADADDRLHPRALELVAATAAADSHLDMIYSDHDMSTDLGFRFARFHKPPWDPLLLLTVNYINHLKVFRKTLLDSLDNIFSRDFEGSQDWDLCFKAGTAARKVAHIPFPLYHWRQRPGSVATGGEAKPWANDAALRTRRHHLALNHPQLELDPTDVKNRLHFSPRLSPSQWKGTLPLIVADFSCSPNQNHGEHTEKDLTEESLIVPPLTLEAHVQRRSCHDADDWLTKVVNAAEAAPESAVVLFQSRRSRDLPLLKAIGFLFVPDVIAVVPNIFQKGPEKGPHANDWSTLQMARNTFGFMPQITTSFFLEGLLIRAEALRELVTKETHRDELIQASRGPDEPQKTTLELCCRWIQDQGLRSVIHGEYKVYILPENPKPDH